MQNKSVKGYVIKKCNACKYSRWITAAFNLSIGDKLPTQVMSCNKSPLLLIVQQNADHIVLPWEFDLLPS